MQPWDTSIPLDRPQDQPKFKEHPTKQCFFDPVVAGLNDWHFVKVRAVKGESIREEVEAVHEDALTSMEAVIETKIEDKRLGVVTTDDTGTGKVGYKVVQWLGTPFTLQREAPVEGCGQMPAGTVVVKARVLNEVPLSSQWYNLDPKGSIRVFWLRHVIDPDLITQTYNAQVQRVPCSGVPCIQNQSIDVKRLKFVPNGVHSRLLVDKVARAKMTDMVDLEVEWALWAQEAATKKAEEKKKKEDMKKKAREEAEMRALDEDESSEEEEEEEEEEG
jgi:hypothetical protein